jgi:proteic killer suppression protein
MAIQSFRDVATGDIAYGRRSKTALRRLPQHLHDRAQLKLARLGAASSLNDLASLPGSRLEKLKGDRTDQHSVRINDQYRICFRWRDSDAYDVEITDYHQETHAHAPLDSP